MFSKIKFLCSYTKGINDKNNRNLQSNLPLYELDQSTKIRAKTLGD